MINVEIIIYDLFLLLDHNWEYKLDLLHPQKKWKGNVFIEKLKEIVRHLEKKKLKQ